LLHRLPISAADAPIDRNNPTSVKVYAPVMHVALYRSAALGLALAAMLLRAFLPDGWMPSDHAGGTFFTICSVEPGHRDGKTPQNEHAPCAFAAASTLAPPALSNLAFGVSTAPWRVAPDFAARRLGSVARHRPNAARAPPPYA